MFPWSTTGPDCTSDSRVFEWLGCWHGWLWGQAIIEQPGYLACGLWLISSHFNWVNKLKIYTQESVQADVKKWLWLEWLLIQWSHQRNKTEMWGGEGVGSGSPADSKESPLPSGTYRSRGLAAAGKLGAPWAVGTGVASSSQLPVLLPGTVAGTWLLALEASWLCSYCLTPPVCMHDSWATHSPKAQRATGAFCGYSHASF